MYFWEKRTLHILGMQYCSLVQLNCIILYYALYCIGCNKQVWQRDEKAEMCERKLWMVTRYVYCFPFLAFSSGFFLLLLLFSVLIKWSDKRPGAYDTTGSLLFIYWLWGVYILKIWSKICGIAVAIACKNRTVPVQVQRAHNMFLTGAISVRLWFGKTLFPMTEKKKKWSGEKKCVTVQHVIIMGSTYGLSIWQTRQETHNMVIIMCCVCESGGE